MMFHMPLRCVWHSAGLALCLSCATTAVAAQNWNTPPGNRVELGSLGKFSLTAPVASQRDEIRKMIMSKVNPSPSSVYLGFEVDNIHHTPNDGVGRQHLDAELKVALVDKERCGQLNAAMGGYGFCYMLRTTEDESQTSAILSHLDQIADGIGRKVEDQAQRLAHLEKDLSDLRLQMHEPADKEPEAAAESSK